MQDLQTLAQFADANGTSAAYGLAYIAVIQAAPKPGYIARNADGQIVVSVDPWECLVFGSAFEAAQFMYTNTLPTLCDVLISTIESVPYRSEHP